MYKIVFYQDKNGTAPLQEYMRELKEQKSKDSRIKLNKMNDYISALSKYGTMLGEPYIKHLTGDIWELRPLRNRILFAKYKEDGFILLHVFAKKTRKTPVREIVKAQKELEEYLNRRKDIDET